jgi:hypothetical protein
MTVLATVLEAELAAAPTFWTIAAAPRDGEPARRSDANPGARHTTQASKPETSIMAAYSGAIRAPIPEGSGH